MIDELNLSWATSPTLVERKQVKIAYVFDKKKYTFELTVLI